MIDQGAQYTDEQLEKLTQKIEKIYKDAADEIQKKLDEFQSKFSAKNDKYLKMVDDGKISYEEYSNWLDGQIFQGEQWQAKKDQAIKMIYYANDEAAKILNNSTISVFAENANWSHYQMESGEGVNFGFGLYDAHAVTNLIKNDPQVLPKWKVNEKKDYKWNSKKVDNAITQGIIQGEKLSQITDRLVNALSAQNRNTMLTFARTAMTGAQNAGRYQGQQDAKELGINISKVWMATLDDHTRASHQALDGEEQKVGDKWHPFKFSNGCRYPGDPLGPPHEVYNCRCTLVSNIADYPTEYKRYDNIDGVPIENMTYSEWKLAKMVENGEPLDVGETLDKNILDVLDKYKDPKDFAWNSTYEEEQLILKELGVKYSDPEYEKKLQELYAKLPEYKANAQKLADYEALKKQKEEEAQLKLQEEAFKQAQEKLDDLMKQVDQLGADKVFSGIWKDDVTYADWEAKKDSIQAKEDYYQKQIEKYEQLKAQDPDNAFYDSMLHKMEDHLSELKEFEAHGEEYSKLLEEVKDAKQEVKDLTPEPDGSFSKDAWDKETKDKAHEYGRYELDEADRYHREYLDKMWNNLSREEKYAVWEYTRNSNPMNKSLSGYHDDWYRRSYIGPENTDWGHEDSWRLIPDAFSEFGVNGHVDYKQAITDLTLALDKSSLPEGCWLVRGSDRGGLAGLIEGDLFSFNEAKNIIDGGLEEMRRAFIGQPFQNHSFMSTGIATGTGFGGGVSYRIYAPAGTHGMYVEPQSYFGDTINGAELYTVGKPYSSVGGEAEILLQRGMTFRITDIRMEGGGLVVEMEVIDQPNYFKHGDEDTFNNGQTRHKK